MPINLRIFLLLVLFLFIILILHTINKKRLLLKYSLLWLTSAFFMIISILFPQILSLLCNLLGIELISNLVFLIGFLILLVLTFVLTIIVSEQKRKIILLIQEMSILKKELREIKNDKESNK